MGIRLRSLEDADLDALFAWESDPDAVALAAFTRADPSDRAEFDAHYRRVRADPDVFMRAIEDDRGCAGMIASFTIEDEREICYWIDPARWGRGLASASLVAFLALERTRPLFARVAEHNVGSATVLRRAGFAPLGTETSYAAGVGRDVVEGIHRLNAP